MLLAVLILFLQLTAINFTAKAASTSSGIDINSTTGWTQVYTANAQNDYQGDQQTGGSTNSVSQDIVGNSANPSTYMKFSDDKTEFAVRIRVNNCNGTASNPQFSNFGFVGIDADGNGTIDFFLGIYNPTGNNGRLGIYNADPSSLNAGPSTTGISGKPLISFAPVKDVNYSIMQANSTIFNDPDYFISFKFKVSDISKADAAFNASTPFRFITGTASQDNSFNQDISGMDENGWNSGKTWLELNVFSPVVSVDGGIYYTVTFDKNTGDTDASPAMKIVQGGTPISILPATPPTKRGMYFQEWNTMADGTGTVVNSSTVVNSNLTVYAIWSDKPVSTVTFNCNGGSWTDGTVKTVSTIDGVIGDNMPVNPTSSNGCFIGWSTDSTYSRSSTQFYDSQTSITGNITLNALWSNNTTYAATFYNNVDTTGGRAISTLYTNPSGNVQSVPSPTRDGYTFSGWYDNINCTGTAFTGGKINSNVNYYAKWTPANYTLTYMTNDGTPSVFSTANVTNGKFLIPTPPTRSGYQFIEWNLKADGTGEPMYSTSDINSNTTVYAIWQQILTVTLDANGGNFDIGAPTSINVKNNKLTALPIPPSRDGYTFLGWSTSRSDTSLVNLTGNFTSSTTLYAVWSPVYTVAFNSNGGSFDENGTQTHVLTAYGNVLYLPDNPTRTGYTFAGWNTADDGSGTVFDTNTNVNANIPVYAIWNINSYKVTFDSQGGSTVGNQNINYDGKVTKPSDSTRTGYRFLGWYKDTNFTDAWDFNIDVVTADTTLHAKWGTNSYTVGFDPQGGSSEDDETITYGLKATKPADPTRTGYSFVGWYKDAGFVNAWDFNNDVVTDNTTLYAKWNQNGYTVTFNSNSGTSISSVNVISGSTVTKPIDPTRTGYSFTGWYKDAGFINAWNFDADAVTENTMLYAKWAINSYTISFNTQGGSFIGSEVKNYGTNATKPQDPTKTGYSFGGWYKESSCTNVWNFDTDVVTADTTLYAKLNINSYTVSFNSQGGSLAGAEIKDYGSNVTKPQDPTRTGYSFGGWYKELSCTNVWNFDTDVVTVNTTLYAKWVINSYKVSFDSQGGSPLGDESIDYGLKVLKPADPTRTGYSFGGWYKDILLINAWNFNIDVVTVNTTLYAKWNINTYTVSFDSQGGSSLGDESIDYGLKVLKPADPSKTGYSFGGWYKDARFNNAWDFNTDVVTANTTLYANWNINSYKVSFDSQGGSSVNDESIDYGLKVLKPADPTRTGYSFGGWYKDILLINAWNFNTDVVTANTTLYAKWVINSYKVSFDSQGGSSVNDESIDYSSKAIKPADPSKTGYSFGGWYKDLGFKNLWNFDTDVVTANTTLYANWNIISYKVSFDSQGGSSVNDESIDYGLKALKPADPSKAGYSFGGWYKDAGFNNAWNFNTDIVTADTTLHAKWNINSYKVSFDSQGGNSVNDEGINFKSKVSKPTDPTRTAYSFGGWYKELSCTNMWNFDADVVTADTTLYAKWNTNSYMVSGNVKDDSNLEQPVPEVKVSVEFAGNVVSGPVYTDSDGKFVLYGVPVGIYDLVFECTDINGNKVIVTQVIHITGDIQVGTVKIPLGRKSSIFVHKGDVTVDTVGNLNEVFDNVGSNTNDDYGVTVNDLDCVKNGGETIVRLEANTVNESTQATQISDVTAAINKNNKYIGYLVDLSVYKFVTPLNGITKTTKLKELNNLIDVYISLPAEIQGKTGYAVYRYHEGKVDIITETPNERGEKIEVNGNTLILTIQKFSVYAIAYNQQKAITVQNNGKTLPQTGSIVDFRILMITGLLLSISGIILLRRKDELKTGE